MTVFLLSYQYDQNIALFAETGQDGLASWKKMGKTL
jgi:hypothetical protein